MFENDTSQKVITDTKTSTKPADSLQDALFQQPVTVTGEKNQASESDPKVDENTSQTLQGETTEEIQNILGFSKEHSNDFKQAGADPLFFAKEHILKYKASGGDLLALRKLIENNQEKVDPIVLTEVERQMFVEDFSSLFTADVQQDPEVFKDLLETKIVDYQADLGGDPQDLLNTLSPEQQQKASETITQIEQERKADRTETARVILGGMSKEDRDHLRLAIDKHPNIIYRLDIKVYGEDLIKLLNEFDQASPDVSASIEEKKKGENISLGLIFLLAGADLLFNRGEVTQQLAMMYLKAGIMPPMLEKLGKTPDEIDAIMQRELARGIGFGFTREMLNQPRSSLYKLIESYDRRELVDMLRDMDEGTRKNFLDGKGSLDQNDIQKLVLSRLQESDLKILSLQVPVTKI